MATGVGTRRNASTKRSLDPEPDPYHGDQPGQDEWAVGARVGKREHRNEDSDHDGYGPHVAHRDDNRHPRSVAFCRRCCTPRTDADSASAPWRTGRATRTSPSSYNGGVPRRPKQPRGPGRPPLPELTLTAPKTAPFTPQQRAQFVSLLTDMIVSWRQEQHLERTCAAAAGVDAHRPEEPPGHSPAP